MKIQCDVCGRDEASVFCCADEAALCDACDHEVHRANKLASKHRCFSLSSRQQSRTLCDICKERRAFVFCQEDRAILCWDCDDPIHTANELTMKHNRFLLAGTRLPELDNNSNNGNKFNENPQKTNHKESTVTSASSAISTSIVSLSTSIVTPTQCNESSISDYLIKTLPGYRVEDLLVDNAEGLYKNEEITQFLDPDLAIADDFPIWAPHVPQIQSLNFLQTSVDGLVHCNSGFGAEKSNQNQQSHGSKAARGRWTDNSFMVPQINTPVPSSNKRTRTSSAWNF